MSKIENESVANDRLSIDAREWVTPLHSIAGDLNQGTRRQTALA